MYIVLIVKHLVNISTIALTIQIVGLSRHVVKNYGTGCVDKLTESQLSQKKEYSTEFYNLQ